MMPPSLEEPELAALVAAGRTTGSATGMTAGMNTGEAPEGISEGGGAKGVTARGAPAAPAPEMAVLGA